MKRKAARKKLLAKQAARKKQVRPIPAGYRAITPYLSVRGAALAIEFYKKVFDAKETLRIPGPEGQVGHAEVEIGDSVLMLSDEYPGIDFLGPQSRGGTTVPIHLYVKDVDATVARALASGAKLRSPVADQFYGDRRGTIEDPFGHVWHVATHIEDPSEAEVKRRLAKLAAK